MRILASNDDGYLSPGLQALVDAVRQFGVVTVVAPDRDRSGASNSLTLENPLRATLTPSGFYKVNGTPTDCVHLGITGLMDEEPDMVVSGINLGANLGDDVIYSGTVAAAMEGRHLGLPAMAVSICSFAPAHLETAAWAVETIIRKLQSEPLPADVILNINIPDLPLEKIHGFRATRLGHRHKAEPATRTMDPRGQTIFWVGPPGPEQDAGEGTDFYAVNQGCISVTPLQIDLTRHAQVAPIQGWLENVTP